MYDVDRGGGKLMNDQILKRGPDGKFLVWGSTIRAWLPYLLRNSYLKPGITALVVVAEFFESMAAEDLRRAAAELESNRSDNWIDSLLRQATKQREAAKRIRQLAEELRESCPL